ncbi:hypothetical protein PTSG_00832 [Salpingoeca rosetta]|uniref:ORM1 protein n=1 Tax=Salpingoeca rosetta (strain ATCC 50818 / BSB-021) TaxID=946362 RepID=F2TXL6_SALR5|nr:uncharacterized protein PTSG_00832 [Salpingoeca rosetta]EGD76125.1 hypothetical protein PTSG_00832 [Salpingoeca rosetta]|eukprot:XP_004998300.1 hypothetical protein PTSG_00832 [Salpingoeca rosetta]
MALKYNAMNPNETWVNHPGFIAMYLVLFTACHLVLLSLPITTELVWTLTNVCHSLITFVSFHWLKGAPFETMDEGESLSLTQWEQIGSSPDMTQTKRFLIGFPVLVFLLATAYTHHDNLHFFVNLSFLALIMIPKLPEMHGVRLFNINKY